MTTSRIQKLILLDNTVLSNFAQIRRPELITNIWGNCATSTYAWNEWQAGIIHKKTSLVYWEGLSLLEVNEIESDFWKKLPKMGDGESSCLSIAFHRHAIFATDDAKARTVGFRYGLEISGTIGFLLAAIKMQEITLPEADTLLKKMIHAGYHSPVSSLGKY